MAALLVRQKKQKTSAVAPIAEQDAGAITGPGLAAGPNQKFLSTSFSGAVGAPSPIWVVGIDPGESGAACALRSNGEARFIDGYGPKVMGAIRLIWQQELAIRLIALEQVGAMPGQGVSSMFKFGTGYGWWQGVLDAWSVPWKLVRPQVWQKGVVAPKSGKEGALKAALRLFPDLRGELMGPREGKRGRSGRVDALLIARWAMAEVNAAAALALRDELDKDILAGVYLTGL